MQKSRNPCNSGIWRKFGRTEKAWWRMFYRDFLAELRAEERNHYPSDCKQDRLRTLAHNCACLATWDMSRIARRAFRALRPVNGRAKA
jgi:hypothetical protein